MSLTFLMDILPCWDSWGSLKAVQYSCPTDAFLLDCRYHDTACDRDSCRNLVYQICSAFKIKIT